MSNSEDGEAELERMAKSPWERTRVMQPKAAISARS